MWIETLLFVVLVGVVSLVLFSLFKVFLMDKIKVNKWVVLLLGLITFLIPIFIGIDVKNNKIITIVQTMIFTFFFLWFLELIGFSKNKNTRNKNTRNTIIKKGKANEIIIKPKAKPNRVKNNK